MADNPTGGAGGEGGPSILSDLTPSVNEQIRALKTNADALQQNQDLLKNVGLAEDEAAEKTKKFGDAIKSTALKSAEALSITNQLSGAIAGFIGKLTSAASLSQHYKRMLDEVDAAQKTYIGSVNFSTKSIGNASVQLQKHIKVMNQMKLDAVDLAKKYKVSAKEFDVVNEKVMEKFSAQIMAAGKGQERLKSIANTVFVLSRTAGMEASEAMETMGQRAAVSDKSVMGLEKDMKALAVVTDDYKNRLKALGVSHERTLLTSKQLVNVLMDLQKGFEHGAVNVKVFGGLMGDYAAKMHKAGLSQNIVQRNLLAMNKLFTDMNRPDLSDFFGVTTAMDVARTGGAGILVSEKVKKELNEALAKATARGITSPIQQARIATEVAQKDIGFQRAQAQKLLSTMPPAILHERLIAAGATARGAVEQIDALKELASLSDEDLKEGGEKHKELVKKQADLEKALKEGSKPESKAYNLALDTRNITERMERYVRQKLAIAIGLAVGGAIVTALAAKAAANKLLGLAGAGGGPGGIARNLMEMISKTGGRVTGAAGRVTGGISRMVGRIPGVGRVGGMLGRVGGAAGRLVGGVAGGAGRAVGAVPGLSKVFAPLSRMFGFITKLPLGSILGTVAKVAGPIGLVVTAIQVLGPALKPLIDGIKKAFGTISSAFKPLIRTIRQVMTPIFAMLGKYVGFVAKALMTALAPAIWMLQKGFQVLGWAAKKVAPVFEWIGDVLNKYVVKPFKWVIDSVRSAVNWILDKIGLGEDVPMEDEQLDQLKHIREEIKKGEEKGEDVAELKKKEAELMKAREETVKKGMEAAAALGSKTAKETLGAKAAATAKTAEEAGKIAAKTARESVKKEEEESGEPPTIAALAEFKSTGDILKVQMAQAEAMAKSIKAGASYGSPEAKAGEAAEKAAQEWKKKRGTAVPGTVESIAPLESLEALTGMGMAKAEAMAKAAGGQRLIIEPGKGEGVEDSQFRSDPATGDIRMKMPGSWVTIRKDDFKNSVAGVVTESIMKGT